MKTPRRMKALILTGVLPLVVAAWMGCSEETNPLNVTDDDTTPPPTIDLESVAPATVGELVVRAPGVRSLALQWVAPGADGFDGIATAYDIRYSASPIDAGDWSQLLQIPRIPAPDAGGLVQKCRAMGLEPATEYYFAMKVFDSHGNESLLSNIAHGTTLQETMPPSPVEDLEVSELATGQYLLSWTARGDDGVLGTATTYDVRYRRFGVISDENWSSSTRVKNLPVPKAAGEREELVVDVPYPKTNYSFAIKTGDEVTNWSRLSDPALALGSESYLWAYPPQLVEGEDLTVVFRAPGDGAHVQIELFYVLGLCGTGDVVLYSGTPEAGIYTITFDFYNRETRRYWAANWYLVTTCIDGERQDLDMVNFME